MQHVPEIKKFLDLAPRWRRDCVGLFKCDAAGWRELKTGALPTESNSPAYTKCKFGGYEMVCTASNQNVYWDTTALDPSFPLGGDGTVIAFCHTLSTANTSSILCAHGWTGGNRGWALKSEQNFNTGNTGMTRVGGSGSPDQAFSSLSTSGVTSFVAARMNSDNSMSGYTDEGQQYLTNTDGYSTSSINRFSIGGGYRASGFYNGCRSPVGPYVLVFKRQLTDREIFEITQNPYSLLEKDWQRRSASNDPGGGGGPSLTPIPPRLLKMHNQHSVIITHGLNGQLQ